MAPDLNEYTGFLLVAHSFGLMHENDVSADLLDL